ncbi:hypothetical protein [Agrobacterium tumefaciens]|uniref:hypothetical protein n=1 Tax=Agrobacterium tumefaciens TaxID=358 RepID=UPI000ADCEB65
MIEKPEKQRALRQIVRLCAASDQKTKFEAAIYLDSLNRDDSKQGDKKCAG